jgi:hypothetical protein
MMMSLIAKSRFDEIIGGDIQRLRDALQEHTEELRQGLEQQELRGAAVLMKRVADAAELIGKAKAELEKLHDTLRFATIPTLMDAGDVRTVTYDDWGFRVQLADDVRCSVPDKDALKGWLVENQLEDMITEQVNAQTLAAFVRRRMKDGSELPPANILKPEPFTRASIVKVA